MRLCLCCKQCEIKPTFSFYCRKCYNLLQKKYNLNIVDYIRYFQTMYNESFIKEVFRFSSLHKIHKHFQYNLQVTDKPLAELLEVILFLRVTTYNRKR